MKGTRGVEATGKSHHGFKCTDPVHIFMSSKAQVPCGKIKYKISLKFQQEAFV